MRALRRAAGLIHNYVTGPLTGRPTTAGFWYLPEVARYRSPEHLTQYRTIVEHGGVPPYLMDYSSKLRFPVRDRKGIMMLPYGEPIGRQYNPEAAFIFALGWLDEYLHGGHEEGREIFFAHARFVADRQSDEGDWLYEFDWPGCRAPWGSALAQGRGASVMARAWRLSGGEEVFRHAAIKAISRFDVPIDQGGYQHRFPWTNRVYFEEYPKRPVGVLNGFMASLLGLFEVTQMIGGDEHGARKLLDLGLESIAEVAPYYLESFGSVYDRNPDIPVPNVNSPRYHRLCISYFEALWAISGDPRLRGHADKWMELDTFPNRLRATLHKFRWKLEYGGFIR